MDEEHKLSAFRDVIFAAILGFFAVMVGTGAFGTDHGGPAHGGGLPMLITYLFGRLMAGLQVILGQTLTLGLFAILALINAAIAVRAFVVGLQVEIANQYGLNRSEEALSSRSAQAQLFSSILRRKPSISSLPLAV
jgi:hypothetical protein